MLHADKYFLKSANCVPDDATATYGVFLRHESMCAIEPAIDFLQQHHRVVVRRYYDEGAIVPAERAIFSYKGRLKPLLPLETEMLMKVGACCISAHNAFRIAMACKDIPILDMHARHAAGMDMVMLAAYGASVGSKMAKIRGAKGFIGSSLDETAAFYDTPAGLGTMPHALIGHAGSTLGAVKLFVENNPTDRNIVALVDYFGCEYSDAVAVGEWFRDTLEKRDEGYKLGVRIDTTGNRYAEGLNFDRSVEIVADWLRIRNAGPYELIRYVMGEDAFEAAGNEGRDRVRAYLFGAGVSAAAIMRMRNVLDSAALHDVQIVASSGFNPRKCKVMAQVRAPIDVIGTGSFLPETWTETYATADIVEYNGLPMVKLGREWLQQQIVGSSRRDDGPRK